MVKVVVKRVNLRMQDTTNGNERTFKPPYPAADLGTEEDLMIEMDWMNTVVDSIKINPYGLIYFFLVESCLGLNTYTGMSMAAVIT